MADARDDGLTIWREYGPEASATTPPIPRITRKTRPHSNSSMLVTGQYAEGVTRSEVEALVRGTFGGTFESFEGGYYRYVAYTD